MKALGVTGTIGLTGCVGDLGGAQDDNTTSETERDQAMTS